MKYKILIICNNAEGNEDAIGKHGKILSEQFVNMGYLSNILSAKSGFGKYTSFFSMAMSWVFCKASLRIIKGKYDFVIVEYPFREHNPIIIIFYLLLFLVAKRKHTKMLLSIHEYDRVNILRRRVIDILMKFCDWIFVSEDKYLSKFGNLTRRMSVRTIPNHIVCEKDNKSYNPNSFCYMGLVNKSKAFIEMLNAWKMFNVNKENSLAIISSSELSEWHLEKYDGVTYYHNSTNTEVVDVMFPCAFSIVPIIPDIGYNNSSFVSAIQCGCVPIGKFGDSLRNKSFVVNVNDYSVDSLVETFRQVQQMSTEKFNKLSEDCMNFGKNFSIEKTALQMTTVMNKLHNIDIL